MLRAGFLSAGEVCGAGPIVAGSLAGFARPPAEVTDTQHGVTRPLVVVLVVVVHASGFGVRSGHCSGFRKYSTYFPHFVHCREWRQE